MLARLAKRPPDFFRTEKHRLLRQDCFMALAACLEFVAPLPCQVFTFVENETWAGAGHMTAWPAAAKQGSCNCRPRPRQKGWRLRMQLGEDPSDLRRRLTAGRRKKLEKTGSHILAFENKSQENLRSRKRAGAVQRSAQQTRR